MSTSTAPVHDIGPVVPEPAADSIVEVQAREVMRLLGNAPSMERVLAVAADAGERFTQVSDAAPGPAPETACGKGCSFCCHLVNIAVSVPEVLAIADHLNRTATPEALETLRARIDAHRERTKGMSREQRYGVRHPCPLLVDDCCSVYDARPLACRGWNSLDVGACEEDHHHPERDIEAPVSPRPVDAARQARQGVYLGLARAGLQHDRVDLVAGLEVVLDRPEAVRRWLAGGSLVDASTHQ